MCQWGVITPLKYVRIVKIIRTRIIDISINIYSIYHLNHLDELEHLCGLQRTNRAKNACNERLKQISTNNRNKRGTIAKAAIGGGMLIGWEQ